MVREKARKRRKRRRKQNEPLNWYNWTHLQRLAAMKRVQQTSSFPRINRVNDNQNPSTSRAAKRAMEFINSCSDLEVKRALDKSNFATKITKVKTIKQGQSHCEGEVSNSIDFRDTRDEVFLFDTGAGVSIIGEAIAIDNKIKV